MDPETEFDGVANVGIFDGRIETITVTESRSIFEVAIDA